MLTMREQVVSKVRSAAKSLPTLQKQLLESAKEAGADWEALNRSQLPRVAAVYSVFDDSRCMYIGQTGNLSRQFSAHPKEIGDIVCFIRLKPSDEQLRKSIEGPLCRILKPKFGTPFRNADCDKFWARRYVSE